MVVPNNHGFPTKDDHFGFWGYRHLRKHPYSASPAPKNCMLLVSATMDHSPPSNPHAFESSNLRRFTDKGVRSVSAEKTARSIAGLLNFMGIFMNFCQCDYYALNYATQIRAGIGKHENLIWKPFVGSTYSTGVFASQEYLHGPEWLSSHGTWERPVIKCSRSTPGGMYGDLRNSYPITDPWDWHIYLHLIGIYGKCR